MIVAPSLHRRYPRNGISTSKHLDGLIKHLDNKNPAVIETGAKYPLQKSILGTHKISITIRALQKLFPKPKKSKQAADLTKMVSGHLEQHCAKNRLTLMLAPSVLEAWIDRYYFNKKLFKFVFPKNIATDQAIFVAYYDIDMFSLLAFFNQTGVRTIDYQHGIQNNHHPMYVGYESYWEKPVSLPGEFWLWDKHAEKRIQAWSARLGIGTRIVGNLHVKYFLNAGGFAEKEPRNTILVALQVWPDYFCSALFEVIEQYQQYNWLFREHPHYPVPEQVKQEIMAKSSRIAFDDTQLVAAEDSLANCCICITGFSTMGLEAVNLDKKAIYTHINALEGLDDYIDGINIIYADNKQAIGAAIDQLMND